MQDRADPGAAAPGLRAGGGRHTVLPAEPEASVAYRPLEPDRSLFINRELSWLEFNQRVLDEARDPSVPLLERLKFAAITSTNVDEFFMVRVAGLYGQIHDDV